MHFFHLLKKLEECGEFAQAKLIYESGRLENDLIAGLYTSSQGIKLERADLDQVFPIRDFNQKCNLTKSYYEDLEKSWHAYLVDPLNFGGRTFFTSTIGVALLQSIAETYVESLEKCSKLILDAFKPDSTCETMMHLADLWPRTNPASLIDYFMSTNANIPVRINDDLRLMIGATLVLHVFHQRAIRCINYALINEQGLLKAELLNSPHATWSPKERPEWLLFQLESNLTIRDIQIQITNEMLATDHHKSRVMQLNMGEGKSSVIIPLLVSALSDGNRLVRVIVLRSLLNTNYISLVQKLGGLLHKRVYIFPCRRDIHFSSSHLTTYKKVLSECQKLRGVVLTLPEYVLSFKLKGVEKCREESFHLAK